MSTRAYGRGRLTDDDRARVEELAARGWLAGRIAQVLKRHQATIQWYMYTHGLMAPAQTDSPRRYYRNGILVQGFSRAEDTFIEQLRKDGLDCNAIAHAVTSKFGTNRSHHTVRCRLKMLASIEDAA